MTTAQAKTPAMWGGVALVVIGSFLTGRITQGDENSSLLARHDERIAYVEYMVQRDRQDTREEIKGLRKDVQDLTKVVIELSKEKEK